MNCFGTSFFTDVQAVNGSRYGKPRKPVHLSNVHCTGREQQLLACEHFEFPTLDDKKDILSHVDVAGILCQRQSQNQTNGSDGNESCDLSSAASLLVPAYFTMIFVMACFALALVWVMYRKITNCSVWFGNMLFKLKQQGRNESSFCSNVNFNWLTMCCNMLSQDAIPQNMANLWNTLSFSIPFT